MKEKMETSMEGEKAPLAEITMDFARHSTKGKKESREPLTKEGIEAAVKAGAERTDAEAVMAKAGRGEILEVFGSPKERTSQSSVFRMLGKQFEEAGFENIDPEDVVRWLGEGGGLKKTETPLLDFQTGEGDYNKEMMENFKKGELFKWEVERSDKAAKDYKQDPDKVTPLSIQAGNVAAFIWALGRQKSDKILENPDSKEKRDLVFGTSHGGVLESFLYKIINELEKEKAADDFVKSLGNQSFPENQGFKAKFLTSGPEDWAIVIDYKGKEYKPDSDLIVKIIQEGVDLKKELKEEWEKKNKK
jgi:hypothetical protein